MRQFEQVRNTGTVFDLSTSVFSQKRAHAIGRKNYLFAEWEPRETEVRFAHDFELEEEGFEPLVPPSKRTAIPSSILRFFAPGCTGCDRFNLRERRLRAPGIPK
jgi:hypothetical protein